MYTSMNVCLHARMCVCTHVCMSYKQVYMYIYIYVRTYVCACIYIRMWVHVNACMYICIPLCTYVRVHTGNLRTRTCASMYIYVCLYYVRIYVYI
jgi:hypothetical protein